MAKTICVVNQKGGVGKTTTTVNLGASLAAANKKTLIVDFDPQGNASSGLGLDRGSIDTNIYHALIEEVDIKDAIYPVHKDNLHGFLDISPSDADLTGAEIELLQLDDRESILKNILSSVNDDYEYIIIDCPPSLSILTVNALTAANSVLVPIQCEYYALEGLGQLQRTLSLIRQRLNPELEIEGYLLTMFDTRNNICHSVANEIKNYYDEKVFKSVISRNVKLAEAPSFGKPLIIYDVKSPGTDNYLSLAKEIIARNNGGY
ncbi:MAG: ParA family protein [Thermodesulfobacteriota bacterium]